MLCCDWLFFNSSDWCISILAVHSVICSLGGPLSHGSPVVVFLDRGHPRFWNFYSTHPVDVVRVKSYMNCLFDSARVVLRVTINEGKFDTTILREPGGQLTTSVYRKPTHTDQYLAYDSHHPQSVKRGIVKCLYEQAKRLVTKPPLIYEEKKHLSSVLVSNGYPFSFLQKLTKTRKPNNSAKPVNKFKATMYAYV